MEPSAIENDVIWSPQPRQALFLRCPADDVVFGGARGGGKTDAVLGDWFDHSHSFGKYTRGLMVRRKLTQLDELIERAKELYQPMGARWLDVKKQFIMPAGGILRMRYLDNDEDAAEYQGHSYTRFYPEELTNFPSPDPIDKLRATLRSAHGIPCQMKATCNPGGPGHNWVKARYISVAPPFTPYSDDGGQSYRVFIPSRLEDNQILMSKDPGYVNRLKRSGRPELVKAWLEGNWDIALGSFFPEFDFTRHVIPAAPVPKAWTVRFRAMDWGSAKPFAVLWFAVADGGVIPRWPYIPRGALVVYREIYGWNGQPNQGLRLPAPAVGKLVVKGDKDDVLVRSLCKIDPSTFATNGGPSIAEMLARNGAWFHAADNRRIAGRGAMGGWDQIRWRLQGDEDGVPMLYIMDNCRHLIRTLPVLPASSVNPDDVDTDAEDHAPDALRYGCMARLFTPTLYAEPQDRRIAIDMKQPGINQMCLADLWDTYQPADNRPSRAA